MEIKLKTLTPLWTGDVNRECSKIKETGIIGSLRWWYEALVRGYGGYACDPISSNCDGKNHCDSCELFGCTGWGRKFRMEVIDHSHFEPTTFGRIEVSSRSYRDRQGRNRTPTWYFPNLGREGNIGLEITPLRSNTEELNALKLTSKVMEEWGAMGARTHLGYGVFVWIKEDGQKYELSSKETDIGLSYFEGIRGNNTSNLPDLKYFFFSKLYLEKSFTNERSRIIKSLELRYDLRQLFRRDKSLRYNIMGTVRGERKGSKIHISRVYQVQNRDEMRIWGWIPRGIQGRNNIIEKIKGEIFNLSDNVAWREFDSNRDNKQKTNDISKFLKENLFGG